jgi:hypothetical protein
MNRRRLISTSVVLALTSTLWGCLGIPGYRPVEVRPLEASQQPREIRIAQDTVVSSEGHFGQRTIASRTLASGSRWREVGRIAYSPKCSAFRSVGQPFTTEDSDADEVYLVLCGNVLIGFVRTIRVEGGPGALLLFANPAVTLNVSDR